MYKHLFRTVLGVVGAFGILSLGTVNATGQATVTYNLNGGYWVEDKSTNSKNVTYMRNDEINTYETTERWRTPSKYDSDGKKWMFDGWYIDQETTKKRVTEITGDMHLYAKRLEFNDQTFTYNGTEVTIMDRDLGNGDHFQWGNNYGFKPCSLFYSCEDGNMDYNNCYDESYMDYYCFGFPNGETVNDNIQQITGYISTYYNNIWMSNTDSTIGDNLRGGENSSNPDENKQGPCPDGYHIPDTQEISKRYNRDSANSLRYNKRYYYRPEDGDGYDNFYNQMVVFGSVSNYNREPRRGGYPRWSSNFTGNILGGSYGNKKLIGESIRCFKNTETKTLEFNTNGGEEIQSMQTSRWWENATTLQNPYRKGSKFIGWYRTSDGQGEKVTTNAVTGNTDTIILYAVWMCNVGYKENTEGTACDTETYTITYVLDGGINNENNTGTYTVETETINLLDPIKEGYDFDGWYSDIDFTTRIYSISKGSVGDKTLYAKRGGCSLGYTENSEGICEKIRVEFDANGGNFGNENLKIIEANLENNPESTIKYSHTPNIDDEGNKISNYSLGFNMNDVVVITGATSLHVKLNCKFRFYGYSPSPSYSYFIYYGRVLMWTGSHSNYTRNSYLSTPIVVAPIENTLDSCRYEFDVEGDMVTFVCSIDQSDSSANVGDRYGYYAIIEGTGVHVEYPADAFDDIPQPTREGHKFVGWYLSDDTEFNTGSVSTGEVTYVHAKWECAQGYVNKQGQCVKEETKPSGGSSGGGGGGGGGSSSSCKNLPTNAVANNNSTPSSNTNFYYSTNTSKVCTFQCKSGYTRNAEKETCDKVSDTQTTSGTTIKEPEGTGNNTKVETGNNTEIQTGSKIDTPEQASQDNKQDTQDSTTKTPEGKTNSTTSSTYSPEFQEAYEFAHENGITTKNTIQSADMNGKLTRIAMAKMLSQYAINVLGKTPDATLNNKFNDVTDKRDADYDNGVTLAYQLGIMGQNMPGNNFRPDDEVSRAEFATALSRMLYNTSDGQYKSTDKYYTNHMSKLVKEGIITKDDPKMKELRGYVMIMLMRSSK